MSGKLAKRQSETMVEKRESCADGWATVSRRKTRRGVHEKEKDNAMRSGRRWTGKEREERMVTEDEKRQQGKDVQVYSKTVTKRVSPKESVSALQRKIKHMTLCPGGDAYVTLAGKVLKEWDMLKDCGVVDGSTVFVSERLRGGAVHKSKKQNKQKKREISEQLEKERQGQEHEVKGDVAESDLVEPEGKLHTQLQELNEKMITESENEAIITMTCERHASCRLRAQCQSAKRAKSFSTQTTIEVDSL